MKTFKEFINEGYEDLRDEVAQAEFGMDYDQLGPGEKEWVRDELNENEIEGGLSDGKSIEDIADKHGVSQKVIQDQLKKGIKVEMEHTNSKNQAEEIALDHLVEMPDYYDKLEKIEK